AAPWPPCSSVQALGRHVPNLEGELKRPSGFTILALLLTGLALGGFGLAYWASVTPTVPRVRWVFGGVGAFYGIVSSAAAFGLWRIRPWATRTLWAWTAASLGAAWLPHLFPSNGAPLWSTAVGTLLVLALLPLVMRYVRMRVPRPDRV